MYSFTYLSSWHWRCTLIFCPTFSLFSCSLDGRQSHLLQILKIGHFSVILPHWLLPIWLEHAAIHLNRVETFNSSANMCPLVTFTQLFTCKKKNDIECKNRKKLKSMAFGRYPISKVKNLFLSFTPSLIFTIMFYQGHE